MNVKSDVTVVPQAALQRGPQGMFVYVVKPDRSVAVQPVTVGPSEGDRVAALKGISPGDTVVVEGADRLHEGAHVEIRGSRSRGGHEPFSDLHPATIATSLFMAAILIAGLFALKQLPISALPEVEFPTIQVITLYPGASADVMVSTVTSPLETQFGQMPGLREMNSSSSGGASVVTLQFDLKQSIDVAEQEVQEAINAASSFLPTDLPAPPVYSKINPADAPIMTLALTSKTLPQPQVEDLAETRLVPKLSEVPGVGAVTIGGGRRPAVRIRANPTALAAYGLTLENIRTAVMAQNVNQAKGEFDGARQSSTIGANDQLSGSAQYKPLVIAYRKGTPGPAVRCRGGG